MSQVLYGIGLARVSTKTQAQVQHGSLEQQRHMIQRFADFLSAKDPNGITYKCLDVIEEDISGREQSHHRRKGLQKIEKLIITGKIDFVTIEKVDRLGRYKSGNESFIKLCHKHKVKVFEVESGQEINLRDRGSRLSFTMKNIWAEEYSYDLEEKIPKKQREAKVNNGKDSSTKLILGLDRHPTKSCMYVISVKEQKIVIIIFEKYRELGSLIETVKFCRKMGYKTKEYYSKEKIDKDGNIISPRKMGGADFTGATLRSLLTSDKLRGYSYFHDDWDQFPDLQDKNGMVRWDYPHGPVVPEDLFNDVQKLLARKKHTNKIGSRVYLLSDILYTPDGKKMNGAGGNGNGGSYAYYEQRENKVRISKEKLENAVCRRAKEYILRSQLLEEIIDRSHKDKLTEIPKIAGEMKRISSRMTELRKVVEGFSLNIRNASLVGPQELMDVCQALLEEKKKAEAELSELENEYRELDGKKESINRAFQQKTLKECLEMILDDFDIKDTRQKKRTIQAIFPKIVLHHKECPCSLWPHQLEYKLV